VREFAWGSVAIRRLGGEMKKKTKRKEASKVERERKLGPVLAPGS